MSSRSYVVVVGGANMDIAGRPSAPLVSHDSNLGTVRLSHGGVGRNIAHNLALLGVDVRLVTVFGQDAQAESLKSGCRALGIDIGHSFDVPGGATSTYLYVMDETGDMQVAINDMGILDELTPERLETRIDLLQGAALVVMETNLPAETLAWLVEHVEAPLFCDPISTVKARKLEKLLGGIHTLKPNQLQAQALSGVEISDEWSLSRACDELVGMGLERAFVSLGEKGLLCADRQLAVRLPLVPGTVLNTTGAGDAMMAGIVWSYLKGLGLEETGKAGLAASSIAVEADEAVNPNMSEALLLQRLAAQE